MKKRIKSLILSILILIFISSAIIIVSNWNVGYIVVSGFDKVRFRNEIDLSTIEISKKGYKLIGFENEKGKIVEKVSANYFRQHIKLRAIFEPIVYTITYENVGIKQGLDFVENNNQVNYTIEDEIQLLNLENEGYNFDGFYLNNQKIEQISLGTYGDIELEARFSLVQYQISYTTSGIMDEFVDIKGQMINSYTVEDHIVLPELTNKGYDFLGYFDGNDKIEQISVGSSRSLELTTKWEPHKYKITYSTNGILEEFKKEQLALVKNYTIEDTINFESLENDGYDFLGYSTNSGTIEKIEKGTVGNLNVVLNWKPTEYQITYANKYTQAENLNPTTYTIEDTLTISNLSLDKYKFVNWENESGLAISTLCKGTTGPITLSANWSMVGEGTQSSPYLIYNEDQLKTLFIEMNAYYELQNDIEISYTWTPIGTKENKFIGEFNGNNFQLKINEIEDNISSFAMFGEIGEQGVIKNLKVGATKGSWIEEFRCNIFAGIALYNNGIIENCINTIEIHTYMDTTDSNTERYSLSGICYYNYGEITNCRNEGSLKVTGSKSAFIAGIACVNTSTSAIITDCYSNQNMVATAENFVYIGKFVLIMENNAILRVSVDKWNLEDNTKLNFIQATTTNTSVGASPIIIKEVAINNNYKSNLVEAVDNGYISWRNIIWKEENIDKTGIMYLETWINVEKVTVEGNEINMRQVLNLKGEWEDLNATNNYGKDYLRKNGGYAYGYNKEEVEKYKNN